MKLKNKLLKIVYSECPKCGGEWEEVENYKVLLQKTFYFLIGVMLVVAILLISLDSELETIENQDRDYQEHIQWESK